MATAIMSTTTGIVYVRGWTGTLSGGSLTLTGIVLAGDGTAAAPSYSFGSAGNTDNGMFLSAANVLGWSAAGTERLTLSASALSSGVRLNVDNTTVGGPALVINRTNQSSHNTIRFDTGNVAKFYIGIDADAFPALDTLLIGNAGSGINIPASGIPQLPAGINVSGGELQTAGNRVGYNLSAYGVGTAYALTDTAAAIDFGTTDPVKVLDKAGTYLIFGQVNLAYTGATVVAETAAVKVRRTNNTAADLSVVVPIDLPVSTTLTNTYGIITIPPFVYTTTATDDSITLFGNVSAALSAGTIDATAIGTSIVAVRLY